MLTITAIIHAKKGHEETVRQALLDHAANVERDEPNTIGFYISQDPNDPCVFATYERFTDQEAMDSHNNSESVAKFFAIAGPILDGDVTLLTAEEISFKGQKLTNADGSSDTFTAGDTFFIAKGTQCIWEITETLRKYYMISE